jgi:hypothetical protein
VCRYYETHGTKVDLREKTHGSLISKAEKELKELHNAVPWRDEDFVIPGWVMRLDSAVSGRALFEELVLGTEFDGWHEVRGDGSWIFHTATAITASYVPMDVPEQPACAINTRVSRTMRVVIQAPPVGATGEAARGMADKVLLESVTGTVQQAGGAHAPMREQARQKTAPLTKKECRALCKFYRERGRESERGLGSKNLRGEGGLQEELWAAVRTHGGLNVQDLTAALGTLVPAHYTVHAATEREVYDVVREMAVRDEEEAAADVERQEMAAAMAAEAAEVAAAEAQEHE